MNRHRWLVTMAALGASSALLAPLPAGTAHATIVPAESSRPSSVAAVQDGVADCVQTARTRIAGAWTCTGSTLAYQLVKKGQAKWTILRLPQTRSDVSIMADPDFGDGECETKSKCTKKTKYNAAVKGNAAFGVGSQVYGTFDVVWQQSFSGPWSRYRVCLDWDSGSAVDPDFLRAQVRQQRRGRPDPVIGKATLYPGAISSLRHRACDPKPAKSRVYVDKRVSDSRYTYHDDLYGYFRSRGRSWGLGTLHLPDFKCPWNNSKKQYRVCQYK